MNPACYAVTVSQAVLGLSNIAANRTREDENSDSDIYDIQSWVELETEDVSGAR